MPKGKNKNVTNNSHAQPSSEKLGTKIKYRDPYQNIVQSVRDFGTVGDSRMSP